MSLLQKFKLNSYCVAGCDINVCTSGCTNIIRGFNTYKTTKMLKANCVSCKRNNDCQ